MDIQRQISNYNHSSGNDIKYIVMHDTGNYKDTAKNNADYFCWEDRQASAHYFVDENGAYQVVEEYNASWHCGDGGNKYGIGNHNSIGIEMCNSGDYIAESTINNTLELVKSLQSKYGIDNDHVVRHYDASRKCCPNNMSSSNWAKWWEFKNRLKNNSLNNIGANSRIEEANQNCYIFTEYLPTGYLGKQGTDFQGLDVLYVNEYMCGVRWENIKNDYGYYAVTELLDPATAIKVKEKLGSWFCEFRTSNK